MGAQGHALLLRTRPVLRVWVSIRITPAEIARSVFECQEQMPFVQPLVNANVCLHIYKSSKDRLGESSLTQNTLTLGVLQPKTSLLPCSLPTWGIHGSFSPCHPLLSPIGDLQSSVTFDLTLDPGRLSPRAIFEETKTWNLTRVRVLGLRRHCEDVRFLLPVRRL